MFSIYDSYEALKDLERWEKEKNIGKRNFKQIEKVHKKNKRKRRNHGRNN